MTIGILLFLFLLTAPILKFKNNLSRDYTYEDYNVILIALTNVRADHMGLYDYYRNTTPNIDRFARNGIIFDNAFSQSSITFPQAVSIFTSQYPFTHGEIRHLVRVFDYKPNNEIKSLPEILKLYGYKTAAFTGGADYHSKYGLDKGFDFYLDVEKGGACCVNQEFRRFNHTIPFAIDWLKKNKDKRFFMFFQSYGAHCPYTAPISFNTDFSINYTGNLTDFNDCFRSYYEQDPLNKGEEDYFSVSEQMKKKRLKEENKSYEKILIGPEEFDYLEFLYDKAIAYEDYTLKTFFDKLNQLDLLKKTIIIITAEHGELFEKHGIVSRRAGLRGTFYDDVIRVPLVIIHPENKKLRRIKGDAQLIDIMPTILAMLQIPKDKNPEGKNLLPLITGKKKTINPAVYGGYDYKKGIYSYIRKDGWKLIKEKEYYAETQFELYNLIDDTQELTNLYGRGLAIEHTLKKELLEWENKTKKPFTYIPRNISDELREEFRKRGYFD